MRESRKYIFFVTRYYGKLEEYRNNEYKYSIVGYYSLKDFRNVCGEFDRCNKKLEKRKVRCKDFYKNCFAVRAKDMKFTTIEKSFPLYSKKENKPHNNLKLLFGKNAENDGGDFKDWIYKRKIENARHLKGRVGHKGTKELWEHFNKIKKQEDILTKAEIFKELRK